MALASVAMVLVITIIIVVIIRIVVFVLLALEEILNGCTKFSVERRADRLGVEVTKRESCHACTA